MSVAHPSPEGLLKAAAKFMRPVVRLLLRSGVTFPMFAGLLRGLFVDVARNEILSDPASRTDSRVSLVTGIHRKELKRQREEEPVLHEPVALTRTSAVVARWLGDPRFAGPDGTPVALPRFGPAPSFDELSLSITRDVRPRAVLDELLDAGVVRLDGELIWLNAQAFIPRPGRDEQVFYFARNIHDHLAAAEVNMAASADPPFVERAVHYDRLSPEAATKLEAAARQTATDMLLAFNRIALAIADEDDKTRPADAPTRRVNLGVYLYEADER